MKKILGVSAMVLALLFMQAAKARAQEPAKDAKPADAKGAEAKPNAETPKEESSGTEHTIKIDGQTISYKATASTTLLKDAKGEPTALIFSTAYTRTDAKDMSARPIAFVYNGGPGSGSLFTHMGLGPRRIVLARNLLSGAAQETERAEADQWKQITLAIGNAWTATWESWCEISAANSYSKPVPPGRD